MVACLLPEEHICRCVRQYPGPWTLCQRYLRHAAARKHDASRWPVPSEPVQSQTKAGAPIVPWHDRVPTPVAWDTRGGTTMRQRSRGWSHWAHLGRDRITLTPVLALTPAKDTMPARAQQHNPQRRKQSARLLILDRASILSWLGEELIGTL